MLLLSSATRILATERPPDTRPPKTRRYKTYWSIRRQPRQSGRHTVCRNRLRSVPIKQPALKGKGCDHRRTPCLKSLSSCHPEPAWPGRTSRRPLLRVTDRWFSRNSPWNDLLDPLLLAA